TGATQPVTQPITHHHKAGVQVADPSEGLRCVRELVSSQSPRSRLIRQALSQQSHQAGLVALQEIHRLQAETVVGRTMLPYFLRLPNPTIPYLRQHCFIVFKSTLLPSPASTSSGPHSTLPTL
ncbi:hypothetical protein Vafri_16546, partial [Volvox africanus]